MRRYERHVEGKSMKVLVENRKEKLFKGTVLRDRIDHK
jgi:hypothetical protein